MSRGAFGLRADPAEQCAAEAAYPPSAAPVDRSVQTAYSRSGGLPNPAARGRIRTDVWKQLLYPLLYSELFAPGLLYQVQKLSGHIRIFKPEHTGIPPAKGQQVGSSRIP